MIGKAEFGDHTLEPGFGYMKAEIVVLRVQHLEKGAQIFLPWRVVLLGTRWPEAGQDKKYGAGSDESGHRNSLVQRGPGRKPPLGRPL